MGKAGLQASSEATKPYGLWAGAQSVREVLGNGDAGRASGDAVQQRKRLPEMRRATQWEAG